MAMNTNTSVETVYTVTRGSEYCFTEKDKWVDAKKLAGEPGVTREKLIEFINNINIKESHNYSGIFFTNTFKVDRPIVLVSVGFHGPHKVKKATYDVALQVEEFYSHVRISRNSLSVIATQGNIFTAEFDPPVPLQAGKYYSIKFKLNGPDTGVCDSSKLLNCCYVEGVTFDFLTGSKQMPILSFRHR